MTTELITITESERKKIVTRIKSNLKKIEGGYITIAGDVAKLRDSEAWKEEGFKNLYEMTSELFGMSRGTTHNLCSIYDNYGDGNYAMPDNSMTVRSMLNEIKEKKLLETKSSNKADETTSENADKTTSENADENAIVKESTSDGFEVEFDDITSAMNFLSNENNSIKRVVVYYN